MYTVRFNKTGRPDYEVILKKLSAGQSLLEIAIDHAIELAHDCGSMCSCGTCHVYIEKGMEHLEFKSLREKHQLAKVADTNEKSRLSCQCVILEGKGEIVATLP